MHVLLRKLLQNITCDKDHAEPIKEKASEEIKCESSCRI
jgi:hypothetical protein